MHPATLRRLFAATCLALASAGGLELALSAGADPTRSEWSEQRTVASITSVDGRGASGGMYAEPSERPEPPAAWKVGLIGLGLVGFQLRRTQRLLHHRQLAR